MSSSSSTVVCQTQLNLHRLDFNARRFFCGEQDQRLNELRSRTGAIIDLQILQGTLQSFQRVQWRITHSNRSVCDFVLQRLNTWMQQSQIYCDMAYEDHLFFGGEDQPMITNEHSFHPDQSTDTSDQEELVDHRVSFADIVAVSKLAQFFREHHLKRFSLDVEQIIAQNSIHLNERIEQQNINNQIYQLNQIILNDHILFPVGISEDPFQAKCNAYQKMFDVCWNVDGVQMKLCSNHQVKVTKQSKKTSFHPNATCLSMADLSSLVVP